MKLMEAQEMTDTKPAVEAPFDYPSIRALFVDIDDTIVRHEGTATNSLLNVLESAAVTLGGMSPEEAQRRIQKINTEVTWWHFSDFIVELNLNPKKFWEYAFQYERPYLKPTGCDMKVSLERIRNAGIGLYVTSNNPSSGILHKLSLAGLGTIQGAPLFRQLLGATELHAMKWEPLYWKKTLAHTGLDASEVAVLGDNPKDDLEVPQSIGIAHTFLIAPPSERQQENSLRVTHVRSFSEVADLLCGGHD